MQVSSSELRSKLGKARGLGSAKQGVAHWWYQRLTAVAIAPLGLWFVYALLSLMREPGPVAVAIWFASPVSAVGVSLLLIALFWHAKLGLQVVVEDYVKSPFLKYALLLGNNFACFALAAVGILSVLKLHFLDIAAGAL